MKKGKWLRCGAFALIVLGVSAWLLFNVSTMEKDERLLVKDMSLASERVFSAPSTNGYAYVDDMLRRIVELPADRPRGKYVHEFVDRVYSIELSKYCLFKFETPRHRNESVVVYRGIMKKLEYTSQRAFEALRCLRVPKRERWSVCWQYLERYGKEEIRFNRLCPDADSREYLAWVRVYEEDFVRRASKGEFTAEEYRLISSDFEIAMGRPLRTLEQIQDEWDKWSRKDVQDSGKKGEGTSENRRHSQR